jgi:hypothetical protein
MEGGIANTRFGADLLSADIVLKKLALGELPTRVWGFDSYFDLSAQRVAAGGDDVRARFWFYVPLDNILALRDDVMAIQNVRVKVRTEVLGVAATRSSSGASVRDPAGAAFVAALNDHYADLRAAYPEVDRVKTLFDLVAIAQGLETVANAPGLDYWLAKYPVRAADTPDTYPLLRREVEVGTGRGVRVMEVDGGIALRALVLRLKDGDVTALRDAVLKSRPDSHALVWAIPLDGWEIPGSESIEADVENSESPELNAIRKRLGTTIDRRFLPPGQGHDTPTSWKPVAPTPHAAIPSFSQTATLSPFRPSDRIGGVMMAGRAVFNGNTAPEVNLTGGNFSLVVEGKNASLSPEAFRRFVTALWAVYFTKQDPGISIDPIAPEVKQHLVRYIGSVINSDLGRAMREADYRMKKWAVGTERPDIPGFRDVDQLSLERGLYHIGASRRFWFVPTNMSFRRGDDMLLFADGEMEIRTEYVASGLKQKPNPADKDFADFFNRHYDEIAAKYPIYRELFDYAKLVGLAKYLRDQGVPLYWFLMANKDLVLTEDSPGTVRELAKESLYREGIVIQGGVDMSFQGRYLLDKAATEAIRAARATGPNQRTSTGSVRLAAAHVPATSGLSFDVGGGSYSVLPQQSLTSGTDRRGIRYQTDLALRRDGLPSVELVRYFNPRRQTHGAFGLGWDLLVPHRISPADSSTREFRNAVIPERMVLENLVTGDTEVLSFSADRYAIAGYVPKNLSSSQVIGLFIMSDASFRLADKLGNEFWFDGAGYLTDMRLGFDRHITFEYLDERTTTFDRAPYQIRPTDAERITFRNVRLPKRMDAIDLVHGTKETLVFSDAGKIVGYVPERRTGNRFEILAILTNESFQLVDRQGNEFVFDAARDFESMIPGQKRRLVRAMVDGDRRIEFAYGVDPSGMLVAANARVTGGNSPASLVLVRFHYDDEGRLASVDHGENQSVASVGGATACADQRGRNS